MLTFTIILGFVMLVAAAINAAKHKDSGPFPKILAGVLIILFLFFLLSQA